jgi:hypothetical protein
MIALFDDALGLGSLELRGVRVIVLCGDSGSGKSSAIQYLLHAHPELAHDPALRIIEELRGWRDLKVFFAQLQRGQRLLIASHLPPLLHRLLSLLARTRIVELDRHPVKISRWLAARGIPYSDASVHSFCAQFGPNYSDAALILRHTGSASFDQALGRFRRQCSLQRHPPERGQPVLVLDVDAAAMHYQAQSDAA